MLCDIVCRKQHEIFRHAIMIDPPTRVEQMIVWLQRGASIVRVKRPSDRGRLPWNAGQSCSDRLSVTTTMAVELTCEGWEEAVSTWEPVSDVFLYAKGRSAKKLKSLRLKADRSRADQ